MNPEFTVLIIEDSPDDTATIQKMLSESGKSRIISKNAETFSEGLDILIEGEIDLVLLDLSLPDSQGFEMIHQLRAKSINLPIIVLSGLDDEETSVQAISEGAQDYVCINRLDGRSLRRTIRYAAERHKMLQELTKANQKIIEQQKSVIEEERLKVLLQLAGATAHELRQPLTTLLGNIELMRMDRDNPEMLYQHLDEVDNSAKRISQIVQKIQTIRHGESKPYLKESHMINIDRKVSILSVEDTDDDFNRLNTFLKDNPNIDVKRAKSIDESLRLLRTNDFDLILLDFMVKDGNGFDILHKMADESLNVPVVVVTGQGDELIASRIIQAGAYDYLPKKKLSGKSLFRTIMNALEKAQLKRQVREANERIAKMSTRDELTGLYNRRYFMEFLEREVKRAQRYKTELVLGIMDLDHFKNINDAHGHPAGDEVLSQIGKMLGESIRESDIACRYGGEEFAIVLPNTNIEDAWSMCERFRENVAAFQFRCNSSLLHVTVSIGIAQYRSSMIKSHTLLIEMADQALYRAKEKGRDRSVVFSSTHEQPSEDIGNNLIHYPLHRQGC